MTAAALGATVPIDTFDGARDLDIRRGTQSGDTIDPARARASPTCAATGAATSSCTPWCRPRPGSTPSRRSCSGGSPPLRGEERPEGRVASPGEGSLFGKLRDAFKQK